MLWTQETPLTSRNMPCGPALGLRSPAGTLVRRHSSWTGNFLPCL